MNGPAVPSMPIAAARSHFPALEQVTYLDLGGRGILPREVRAAIDRHLDHRMLGTVDKDGLFATTEAVRARFAQFVNATPDEIAYTKNVSDGLNMVATGLAWQPGDNVVLCPELEHPNNVFPWLNLQATAGIAVKFVEQRGGFMPVDALIAAIDDRTRVVTCSTATFSPGFRTDIDRLGRACRERGVLFLVDAAQSLGVLHLDVESSGIDALAVSTQKGLLGLYGMGFLYVRSEIAERMRPAYLARFGVDSGEADVHTSDYGAPIAFMRGARRFDLGNYNYLAVVAAGASLELLSSLGTRNIEAHAVGLAHDLARGALELGLPVCGGAPGPHLAHMVSVGVYGAGGDHGSSDERMNRIYRHLLAHDVKLSMRRGVLRFSMHAYNNTDDVERVLFLMREALGRERA
jgi:cysteine desulfurase/selenocysteine lyase